MSPLSLTLFSTAFLIVFGALFYGYTRLRRAWSVRELELVRSRALVQIIAVLYGSPGVIRDKMKNATRILSDLGDQQGWRCRVVLHADPATLPPSGGGLGFHLPIAVHQYAVGTLIISKGPHQFTASEKAFFDALRQSLASFIARERLWDDFHSHLERVQASLLLGIDTTPQDAVGQVTHMLSVLKES
jgi:hypothetical protein